MRGVMSTSKTLYVHMGGVCRTVF